MFAENLMLFCKGGASSIMLIMRALRAFSQASGLQANNEKTIIYFGKVKEEVHHRML